jgi:uncharacterized protein YegP (UPF0339 family)
MYFILYDDFSNEWRWTLYAEDHKKIADSAESYPHKSDAMQDINLVKGANAYISVIERPSDIEASPIAAVRRSLAGLFSFTAQTESSGSR